MTLDRASDHSKDSSSSKGSGRSGSKVGISKGAGGSSNSNHSTKTAATTPISSSHTASTSSSHSSSRRSSDQSLPSRPQRMGPVETQREQYVREVATQGFLYVGTFYSCYTIYFVVKGLEAAHYNRSMEQDIFLPWLVLSTIGPPSLGFFNMF